MTNKKNVLGDIKKMIDYDESVYDNGVDGFIKLKNKISRNNSFMKYVLYISKKCFGNEEFFTIKDVRTAIQEDEGNIRKITSQFLDQGFLVKRTKSIKCYYKLKEDNESLKAFSELLETAKDVKNGTFRD